jgi:Uma2 family endonuclease
MGAMTVLPREFTREDLDAMPDDGNRHELLDGSIMVTPAPAYAHQRMVRELLVLLHTACPKHLEVLTAPFDVVLSQRTVVEPDLLVARRQDFTRRDLPGAPLLAIEVVSPSTRRTDLGTKKDLYQEAGTVSYWVVDPDQQSLTAWQLVDGTYEQRARVVGDQVFSTELPFPVSFRPADLLD